VFETRSSRSRSSSLVMIVPAVETLHGVLIDVLRDRLAQRVADGDCARVVHAAPDAGVVGVRARSRDAGVGTARLSGRRQRKRLPSSEVAEEDGRARAILAGMASRVFRV